MIRCVLLVLTCLAATSCYRTHYLNLSAENPLRSAEPDVPVRTQGWQSFFVWGWFPIEKRIDASKACGGTEKLESIRTQRTFLEGLVAAFAGYYINIYSPWDGAVYCTEEPD